MSPILPPKFKEDYNQFFLLVSGLNFGVHYILSNNSNNSNSNNTPASSDKAITAFSFTNPAAIGTINEQAKTIAITVPHGADVASLAATFTTTGTKVTVNGTTQTSGSTTNNFGSSVEYTVTAADNTTAVYTVTVEVAPQTTFTVVYAGGAGSTGTAPLDTQSPYISGATVTVLASSDTDINGLRSSGKVLAGWSISGSSTKVDYVPGEQFSINSDTTLTAVWVTPTTDGMPYPNGGGIIIAIDESGTPKKALIMATSDQSSGSKWDSTPGCDSVSYCTSTSALDGCFDNIGGGYIKSCTNAGYTTNQIGSGSNAVDGNTYKIIDIIGDNAVAAKACTSYTGGGYTDWYLPSIWELNTMYNYAVVHSLFASKGCEGDQCFAATFYWSSTEGAYHRNYAWYQNFNFGFQDSHGKYVTAFRVRAVRAINY